MYQLWIPALTYLCACVMINLVCRYEQYDNIRNRPKHNALVNQLLYTYKSSELIILIAGMRYDLAYNCQQSSRHYWFQYIGEKTDSKPT